MPWHPPPPHTPRISRPTYPASPTSTLFSILTPSRVVVPPPPTQNANATHTHAPLSPPHTCRCRVSHARRRLSPPCVHPYSLPPQRPPPPPRPSILSPPRAVVSCSDLISCPLNHGANQQVMKCADAGADMVRITVQGMQEAKAGLLTVSLAPGRLLTVPGNTRTRRLLLPGLTRRPDRYLPKPSRMNPTWYLEDAQVELYRKSV